MVHVESLSASYRAISPRLRPKHPPLFDTDWPPTRADAQLALALIEALDDESREWYAASAARLRAFLGR